MNRSHACLANPCSWVSLQHTCTFRILNYSRFKQFLVFLIFSYTGNQTFYLFQFFLVSIVDYLQIFDNACVFYEGSGRINLSENVHVLYILSKTLFIERKVGCILMFRAGFEVS